MTNKGFSLDNTIPFSRKTEKLLKKSTLKYTFFFVSLRENERLMTIPNVFVKVSGERIPPGGQLGLGACNVEITKNDHNKACYTACYGVK